jgi:phage terminase large subunit-like protein
MLRPSLMAGKGKRLVVADWAAIEARVTPWASNSSFGGHTLDIFANGEDLYCHNAAATFHVPYAEIVAGHEAKDKKYSDMRQIGKVQELACGFAGGVGAFASMGRIYGLLMSESDAKRMVEAEPELAELCNVYRDVIEVPSTGSVYRVLSAEAYTKEGLNPSPIVIFDEVHAQPNRELWDVMSLAGGARADSLLLGITTAGVKTQSNGQDSLCYSLYQYGQKLVKGELVDPSFFFAWWEPKNPEADHRNKQLWIESNPGFADIVDAEDFESAVLRTPEAEFRTKRTNTFVSTITAWLPTGAWEHLIDKERMPEPGEDVILAFDGAFSNDSTALVAWLLGGEKPHLMVVGLWERPDDAEQGWHVPVAEVEQTIIDTARDGRFSVKEIVFDPARWQRTFMILDEEGLPVVQYPNSAERMVPATQKFYEAVVNQSFTHDGDERLARHISNCVTKQSSRGVMVAKASSKRKVDAAVASIFGYDRATQPAEPKKPVARFFSLEL